MAKQNPSMITIAYIHGFNSSPRSFGYLRAFLPEHDVVLISYNSHQPIRDSMLEVRKQLPKGRFFIVGHSLGGLLTVLMAAEHVDRVDGAVTISAPLGGSKSASMLRWIPGHPKIIHDLTPTSEKIELISQLKLQIPVLSIISTGGGLATTNEPNDSIVTVASQRALKFGKKIEVKANHFEVLMHEKTVKHIQDFVFQEETA